MNISHILKSAGWTIRRNSNLILTLCGSGGVITTAWLAMNGRSRADLEMKELEEKYHGKIPTDKKIKTLAPIYAPALLSGAMTIGCIVGLNKVSSRQRAVLASMYSASELALKEYQGKVRQMVGEKKEKAIRDEIARDRIERVPLNDAQVIITGNGDHLCFDSWSGRYFRSNIEMIRQIQNRINAQIISSMWVTLNEVYYEFGLAPIPLGDMIGWNVDNMLDVRFSSQISNGNEPCIVMDFANHPVNYNGKPLGR